MPNTSSTDIVPQIDPHTLQWALTTTIFLFAILCLGLHAYYAWDNKRQKKTSTKDTISIILDDAEKGDAIYLISIVTSSNYRHAPTAVTTLHLIGSTFPGRVHDIYPMSSHGILVPLTLLKVVVKEDVNLDPIIAIVIKTNNSGPNPTWRCKQIIVRNLATNSAWLFLLNDAEIGFSRCYTCVPYKDILSFPVLFKHRLKQENSNGIRAYTGVYAGNPLSAYTIRQRIFLSVATHFFTLNVAMMSYSIIFQYSGFKTTGPETRSFDTSKYTIPSLWLLRMAPVAILAALLGSIISYFVNKLFREKGRYEIGLSETDHYVATALREAVEVRTEQLRNMKNTVENLTFAEVLLRESKAKGLIHLHRSTRTLRPAIDYRRSDGNNGMDPQQREQQRDTIASGFSSRRRQGSMFTALQLPEILSNVKPYFLNRKRKSNIPVYIVPYVKSEQSQSTIDAHISRMTLEIIPKFVLPSYRKLLGFKHQKILPGLLPGEMDPEFFKRPECKPVVAWIVAITIFLGGFIGCVTVLSLDIEYIFSLNGVSFLIILATFLMAISFQLSFFETFKLYLVAYILTKNDLRLYHYAEKELLLLQDVRFQYRQTLFRTLFRPKLENILHSSFLLRKKSDSDVEEVRVASNNL